MNLYNRLRMHAPNAQQVAAGAFKSNTMVAPQVAKTNVLALLDRSSNARGYIDGAHERPYTMGQYGVGLNGLGNIMDQLSVTRAAAAGRNAPMRNLRGLGDTMVTQGVTFKNDDAYNDFVHGVMLRDSQGQWSGVPQGMITAFQNAMLDAANSGPAGGAAQDAILSKAQGLAASIDTYQRFGIGGRSVSQDQLYRGAMKQLKALIMAAPKTLKAAVAADVAAGAAPVDLGPGPGASTGAGADAGAGGRYTGSRSGGGTGKGTGTGAATASGTATSKLPFILGGGLLLAGGLFYVWRKRK